MPYDEELDARIEEALAPLGVERKKMFGGTGYMLDGNMLCGVHPGGAMYRVGKDNEPFALAIPGARRMEFTGRQMGGFVEADDEAIADDTRRARLLDLALDFVRTLPAK